MPLIQYGPALGVGCVGENELLDFYSQEELDQPEFLRRMNSALPQGFRFKSLERLGPDAPVLIKAINRAEYEVSLDAPEIAGALSRFERGSNGCHGLQAGHSGEVAAATGDVRAAAIHCAMIDGFMSRESYVITRAHKAKRQSVDVRRYAHCIETVRDGRALRIVTEISPNGGVKPVEVVAAVYGLTDEEKISLSSRVRRTRLYSEDEADRKYGPLPAERAQPGIAI